jgi:hypothetical protein
LPFYKSSPKKTTAQKANIRPILSPCPRSAVFTLYAYIQRHLKDAAARLCGSFNTRFLSVFLSTTPLSLCLCVCTSFYISVLSSSNYSTHVLFRFTFLLFLFSLFFFFLSFYASHETDFSNFLRRFLPLHTYIGTYIRTYFSAGCASLNKCQVSSYPRMHRTLLRNHNLRISSIENFCVRCRRGLTTNMGHRTKKWVLGETQG